MTLDTCPFCKRDCDGSICDECAVIESHCTIIAA